MEKGFYRNAVAYVTGRNECLKFAEFKTNCEDGPAPRLDIFQQPPCRQKQARRIPIEDDMKSTFHELELGKAVLQNSTDIGNEQLIVTLQPDSKAPVQIQIRQNTEGSSSTSSSIGISPHGLQQLVHWLREEGAIS